jgi:hypothetical protein
MPASRMPHHAIMPYAITCPIGHRPMSSIRYPHPVAVRSAVPVPVPVPAQGPARQTQTPVRQPLALVAMALVPVLGPRSPASSSSSRCAPAAPCPCPCALALRSALFAVRVDVAKQHAPVAEWMARGAVFHLASRRGGDGWWSLQGKGPAIWRGPVFTRGTRSQIDDLTGLPMQPCCTPSNALEACTDSLGGGIWEKNCSHHQLSEVTTPAHGPWAYQRRSVARSIYAVMQWERLACCSMRTAV